MCKTATAAPLSSITAARFKQFYRLQNLIRAAQNLRTEKVFFIRKINKNLIKVLLPCYSHFTMKIMPKVLRVVLFKVFNAKGINFQVGVHTNWIFNLLRKKSNIFQSFFFILNDDVFFFL